MSTTRPCFFGESDYTIDDKHRISIPESMRAGLGNLFVITRGPDKVLFLFPMSTWNEIEMKIKSALFDKNIGFMQRMLAGRTEVSLDAGGRLTIPRPLEHYAELNQDLTAVTVVGQGPKIEIWQRKRWQEHQESFTSEKLYEVMEASGLGETFNVVAA